MNKGPISQFIEKNFLHFNAAALVDAAKGYEAHLQEGGKLVALAGAMSTAELGISLAEMIRQGKIDIISCTGANLEEDVMNLVAHSHYKRVPHYRDLTPEQERELLDSHYNRVTDTCIPEEEAFRRLQKHLEEVWPNLEVFFHGGIAFTPYREQYKQIITKSDMHYMETYNASEGFFGIQDDPSDSSMSLMLDYGIFYEFLPMDEFGNDHPNIVPLSGVETGRNYAMLISSSCGLWRYEIGDTIQFTSTNPYKFIITGRTKYFINAFGEELIMDNAEKGLEAACKATGAQISDYTAAPIYMDANAKCRHQWLIEFAKEPDSIAQFAAVLDTKLQEINSDYEAKRFHNVTLQPVEIVVARKELFNDWLKTKGKLGGQHKIPRLSNSRTNIEELLSMNQ